MNRFYNQLIIRVLVICLAAFSANAQLAGIYTINSASPTAASNFSTFTDLATVLNSAGVSGAVTVNVLGASNYNEQVEFTQAPGVSTSQNIVINGNNHALSFTSTNTAQPWTLLLNGADFMTFNNLFVEGLGASNPLPCHLTNNADNNHFASCSFSCSFNGSGSPFSISGSSLIATTIGNAGSNNSILSCTMSGGQNGVSVAGNTGSPFTTNNTFVDCIIQDFFSAGVLLNNSQSTLVNGCIIERPTLTIFSLFNGVNITNNCEGTSIDGNRIRHPAGASPSSASTVYGINITGSGTIGNEIIIKNNLLYELNFNGSLYGIRNNGSFVKIYHNTISMDDVNCNSSSSSYGIYTLVSNTAVKNNLISISRNGSGIKYGLYYGGNSLNSNGNCVYIAPNVTATAVFGYGTAQRATYLAWKNNETMDQQGGDANPFYTNITVGNYLPTSAILNNVGEAVGVNFDILNLNRSAFTPDPGAYEFLTPPCSATFTYSSGASGLVNFTSTSAPINSISTQFIWSFGNGNTYSATGVSGMTSTQTYTANGTYIVTLSVNNITPACSANFTLPITVNLCNLNANFTNTVATGGSVSFNSVSSGTNTSTTYTWNFGNGYISNAANPSITYTNGGVYNVMLQTKNSATCSSSISKTISLNFSPCYANANFNMMPTTTPQYWSAIPAFPWNVTNASWNWGDNTPTTNSLYTSHQYSAAGLYTICLTVTVNCASTASSCTSYSIFKTTESANILYVNVVAPDVTMLSTTGLSSYEELASNFDMYPNPSNGIFTIALVGTKAKFGDVAIYSSAGMLVYSDRYTIINESLKKEFETKDLANGIYLVKVSLDGKNYLKKLIISK
jgi:PKD repeat protein